MNARAHRHRGFSLIMLMVLMVVLCAFVSLAADYGRVQLAKTELQSAADAAARAAAWELKHGNGNAKARAREVAAENGAVAHASDVALGKWNKGGKKLDAAATPDAVEVTLERSAARGNPISLPFAAILGVPSFDITATAVARLDAVHPIYGLIGLNLVTMGGSASIDSYRSTDGAYGGSNRYNRGSVASNGNIALNGASQVRGDARPGVNGSVTLGGNDALYVDFYAPLCDIHLTGTGDLYGQFIGRSISMIGNGAMHFDESLMDPASTGEVVLEK